MGLIANLRGPQGVAGVGSPVQLAPAPFNGIDSSGNSKLNAANLYAAQRMVARETGTLSTLWWKVKVELADGASYTGGTLGTARVRFCTCNADGTPNLSNVLATIGPVAPADPSIWTGNKSWKLNFGVPVTKGTLYAVVVDNTDPTPATNYFSAPNNHYLSNGAYGAQTRNELNAAAPDVYESLYPQEINMASTNGGATWNIPGSAGSVGVISKYMPTFVQVFSGGHVYGVGEYYSATTSYTAGTFNMVYQHVPAAWTFNRIGLYLSAAQTCDRAVTVIVDDVVKQQVRILNPPAGYSTVPLPAPQYVAPSSVVKLQFPADSAGTAGIALKQQYSDSDFDRALGHGTGYKWYCAESPARAFPVWPLPYFDTSGLVF